VNLGAKNGLLTQLVFAGIDMLNITKRVDLNLGYSCNANCLFCYYKISANSKKDKDLTTEQAKQLIRYIKKKGKEVIDFTGGEPTIRRDIFDLVSYAKALGFEELSIITNGLRLADMEFLKNLVNSGIDDLLFSVHGHDAEVHDMLVGVEGAFERLVRAIKNAKKIDGLRVRTNTVVNGMNFKHVVDIAYLLYSLGVEHVNFILFNPIVEANCCDERINVRYSEAAPYLKKAIDRYRDKFQRITIRYLPFCFLPGYEEYITECPQIQYDPFEWDYFIRMRIRNGIVLSSLTTIIGLLLLPKKRILSLSPYNLLREAIMRGLSFKNKTKHKVCKECKFDYICDGVWKEYARVKGLEELRACLGNKVEHPAYFLRV